MAFSRNFLNPVMGNLNCLSMAYKKKKRLKEPTPNIVVKKCKLLIFNMLYFRNEYDAQKESLKLWYNLLNTIDLENMMFKSKV